MSISDILTSDILTRVTAVSLTDMLLTVLLSFCTGMFIFYIYQKTFRGVLYSLSFGLSLVSLCMISAMLILAVSSNVVLSLGMVGALSIVRFRTAIKEPLDIVFLFWSIAAGIVLSAGMIPLAVFGSLAIGLVILRISHGKNSSDPYLIIAHLASAEHEEAVMEIIRGQTSRQHIKGKTISADGSMELTVEVQVKDDRSAFVRQLSASEGVSDVVMVAYNGDYMQ